MIQRTYFSFYSNFLDDSMNVNGVQASRRCLQEGKIASNFSVPSENRCGHRKLHFSQPLNLSPYIRASGTAITLNYCLGVSTSSHLRGIQIVSRRGFLLARVHLLHFTWSGRQCSFEEISEDCAGQIHLECFPVPCHGATSPPPSPPVTHFEPNATMTLLCGFYRQQ